MNYLEAIVLAVIEGLTEFLPVSSTGHMVLASSFMKIANNDFTKLFTVAIQLGAILSVLVLYWKKFLVGIPFYIKLLIAFIPAAIFGKLLNDYIDALLENPITVAIMLVLGGIVFLLLDKWMNNKEDNSIEEPTNAGAFKIGLYQCIALIPGVSRSAATIIGGITQGLNRKSAAEFSFFLAVPTMFAATAYKLLKYFKANGNISKEEINLLLVGNLVAFIVAIIAIKTFITFLNKNGFKLFGYYRIIAGIIILIIHQFFYPLTIL
ncbi:MAG: undecaprenyl-diphosphate phosphatase [Bacteroidota bacterium]